MGCEKFVSKADCGLQGLRKYVAKIGDKNEASQRLFKQLHFKEVGRSTVFREITFSVQVSDLQRQLLELKKDLVYSEYDIS